MQQKRHYPKIFKSKDWFAQAAFPFRADRTGADNSFPRHKHEFFEFFLMVEGKLRHSIDGKTRIIEQGDIVLLNPNRAHSFRRIPGEPVTRLQVIFLPSFLGMDRKFMQSQKSLVELVYLEPFYQEGCIVFRLVGKTRLKVQALMEELIDEYDHRPKGYEMAIRAKLIDLLITVARTYAQEQKKNPLLVKKMTGTVDAIIRSLAYIEEHFTEPLQLETTAARIAGVTKEYFSHVFHKITGNTFTTHLIGLRVNHARKLLAETDEKIISICFASGFNDVSHFNRTFKKTAGITPLEYRRQHRAKN